ncbi:ImmA/IrrE family metallo-endopeptidase [Alkalihalobacillus macyae]|uniref:ImmA/IrrE family metallo-endopeptidase n=1 Tax=Guptibacillus hwajinpoensis TaxID=208199 RepID=UPI00273A8E27|nr:ImmA/IrrE family metallo-endopeptidase [Alkalihalobacillus macyae]MDP4553573.1 ImmA/IrrE family metallo-endopeptidase [Alkalihalobacillus macyae]
MSKEFIVPTGSIIKEYLDEIGMSQKECTKRLGISEKHLSNLLNGKSRLTEETAIKLEKIFHEIPASYWLNYESKYREQLKREEINLKDFNEDTLNQLNQRYKFSEVFSGLGWDLKKQANEMLKLLRISSFDQFDRVYSNLKVDFMEDGGEKEAIAIWLNLAREEVEIQNKDLTNKKYDKEEFLKSLNRFKKLALNKDYENSLLSARKLLNRLGVYLVFCDAIVNSKVRGALTTYLKSPAIFLSGRFKTHDHIWFALMHEIGHLILHYDENETIVTLESELELDPQNQEPKENEANSFARDFFINSDDFRKFIETDDFNKKNIEDFADSQNILPGIVVARLQHDGYLSYDKLNYIKNK